MQNAERRTNHKDSREYRARVDWTLLRRSWVANCLYSMPVGQEILRPSLSRFWNQKATWSMAACSKSSGSRVWRGPNSVPGRT